MHHRIVMSKFIQRTCLAVHCSAELHANALVWRWCFKEYSSSSKCSSDGAGAGSSPAGGLDERDISKRFYSKFPTTKYYPTARLGTAPALCDAKAYELVIALSDAERVCLRSALDKYEAELIKKSLEGKLALAQWRTRFGRPSKVPPLSNVDPTGAFCTFPEDWFKKKAEEKSLPPSVSDLYKLFFVNAVPFVAFGFLDNFCMIMAGDYLEDLLGTFMCISTMAAAGLGNTVSDLVGICTASYVERVCAMLGLRPPELTQIQMEMKQSRRASNVGRVIGITIGCLLGMTPLYFLNAEDNNNRGSEKNGGKGSPSPKKTCAEEKRGTRY